MGVVHLSRRKFTQRARFRSAARVVRRNYGLALVLYSILSGCVAFVGGLVIASAVGVSHGWHRFTVVGATIVIISVAAGMAADPVLRMHTSLRNERGSSATERNARVVTPIGRSSKRL
jgi:membrane protein implicated in regulation of membrane protease activity